MYTFKVSFIAPSPSIVRYCTTIQQQQQHQQQQQQQNRYDERQQTVKLHEKRVSNKQAKMKCQQIIKINGKYISKSIHPHIPYLRVDEWVHGLIHIHNQPFTHTQTHQSTGVVKVNLENLKRTKLRRKMSGQTMNKQTETWRLGLWKRWYD